VPDLPINDVLRGDASQAASHSFGSVDAEGVVLQRLPSLELAGAVRRQVERALVYAVLVAGVQELAAARTEDTLPSTRQTILH
jgi:hypothetical protein